MRVSVICAANSFEKSLGKAELYRRPWWDRLGLTILSFLIPFSLALLAAFVPFLHWILVPGLVGLSLLLSWRQLLARDRLDLTGLSCPSCAGALGDGRRPTAHWPVRWICQSCARPIVIELQPSES